MQITICDDDTIFCKQLSTYITAYFRDHNLEIPEISILSDGNELISKNNCGDLLFLDIEMPGMNGIEAGNLIKKDHPHCIIIVITAYDQYLDDAMRFHVFRYLSKPLQTERLYLNLQDALVLYESIEKEFTIRTDNGLVCISSSEILMIEAANHGCFIETTKGRFYSPTTIEYWALNLPSAGFFRCHRSYIVNLAFVSSVNGDIIYLKGSTLRVTLAQRKSVLFRQKLIVFRSQTQ